MPAELRKRAAPAPAAPPPKAKKPTTTTSKAKKEADASKESEPPASNPAEDAKAGIPDGAGGGSTTAISMPGAEAAKEVVAVKVKDAAVKAVKVKRGAASAKLAKAEVDEEKEEEVVGAPKTGGIIKLEGFGQGIETNDGESTTLAKLVEASKAGVVLFTYPKASMPGCTRQAGMFRDAYEPLTATGLSIYGLSTDSPKSNTTFKTKQKLPYPLLCDPSGTLISAIGFKSGKSITRGVFVVDKSGNVLAAGPGGPQATVDMVKCLVETMGGNSNAEGILAAENMATTEGRGEGEDELVADMVAEIADSAEMVDA